MATSLAALFPLTPELVVDIDFTQPGNHLALTFDDGGKSALHVSDELCKRGWRGHFFIITSRIGGTTFLDEAGIRQLRSCGHIIGSHSHTHPHIFRDLSRESMIEEWRVSRDILTQLLGEPCDTASVPGGDISPVALRYADEAGLGYLFTSEPWLRPRQVGSCWILGRAYPKVNTPLAQVRNLAHLQGWRRALALRRTKGLVKLAIAPLYRYYVGKTMNEQ